MPITMIPAQPLSPAAQLQAQALAQSMMNQGMGVTPQTGLNPGLGAFAGALGKYLHGQIGQYQQNALNDATMVSPVQGP